MVEPEAALQGLGAFFAWISLVKYLEWGPGMYTLILAVKASVMSVVSECDCFCLLSPYGLLSHELVCDG